MMENRFFNFPREFPTTLLSKTSLNATDITCMPSPWPPSVSLSLSQEQSEAAPVLGLLH